MRLDDRSRDRESDPEAVRFRRDEWCEQRAVDLRRQTRSSVAHRDVDIGRPDFGADGDATTRRRRLGHRVHGVHHQVHQHLLQEHLIAVDDAGMRRQIDGGFDLPRSHVVSHERKTFIDHGVEVDRFRVQLTASEHGPMPIDDLCGLDALGLDVGKDLAHRVGRRTIGGDHHPTRLGVVNHRAEGLTELMGNRARQRRHRQATTGVGGERQVPPALDLGPAACAALIQEPDDQERLDGQYADGAEHRAPVCVATGSERDSARRCPAATGSRGCPTAVARASRISVDRAVAAAR